MASIWTFTIVLFLGCTVLAQTKPIQASLAHRCKNKLACYMSLPDEVIILSQMKFVAPRIITLLGDKEMIADTACTDFPSSSLPGITCSNINFVVRGNNHSLTIRGVDIKCPMKVDNVNVLTLESCSFSTIALGDMSPQILNLNADTVLISNTNFIGNTIQRDLLLTNSNEAIIANCIFENNTINEAAVGTTCPSNSLINKQTGKLSIKGSLFKNNTIHSLNCNFTGIIKARNIDTAEIDSTVFVENILYYTGTSSDILGCIVDIVNANQVTVRASVFERNNCSSLAISLSSTLGADIEDVFMKPINADVGIICNPGSPYLFANKNGVFFIKTNCTTPTFCAKGKCCNSTFDFANYLYDHPCGGAMIRPMEPVVGGSTPVESPTEVAPVDEASPVDEAAPIDEASCLICETDGCSIVSNCSSDVVIVGNVVINRETFVNGDFTNNGKVTLILNDNAKIKVTGCVFLGNFTVDVSNVDTSSSNRIPIIESTCVNGTVIVVGADECTSTSQEHDGNRFHVIFDTERCSNSKLGIILGVILGLAFIIVVATTIIVLMVPSLREEIMPYSRKNRQK